jgi:hypothetical protein
MSRKKKKKGASTFVDRKEEKNFQMRGRRYHWMR